jgi:2-alkenal reductase
MPVFEPNPRVARGRGYSPAVRSSQAAALALVAAVVGGALVLVVARAAGWLHGEGGRTVVVQPVPADAAPAVSVAKPLTENAFRPAEIYRTRSAGVVTIVSYFGASTSPSASAGQGSGFVVRKDGLILTNAHVITTAGSGAAGEAAPARTVYVEYADGDRVQAEIVGYDLFDDVGVVRVDPADHALAPVPLGRSSRVVVGEPVAAIGSPFGITDSLSVGVVSAIHRAIPSLTTRFDIVDAIQTDAPINHGNSGGPLFDARGLVVGINAQIRSSGTDSGSEGVGFAVPIDSARRSLRQLIATGHVRYAYVGITTEDLTPSIAQKFGYAARQGALIDAVQAGSAAARAGLEPGADEHVFDGQTVKTGGDAIVAIDGIPVRNAGDVVRIVSERLAPGDRARFTVVHGAARRVVTVTLAARTTSG